MAVPDIAAAGALIDAVHLDDPASVAALGAIEFSDAGAQAARQRIEGDASGDPLWAAVHVYVTGGTDPAPLVPLLTNADPRIRVLAAAGLVSLGRADGFDTLAASITSGELMHASHPPVTVARYAAASLSRYTADALPVDPTDTVEQRTALAAAWSAWLAANRSQLGFDPDTGTWAVR